NAAVRLRSFGLDTCDVTADTLSHGTITCAQVPGDASFLFPPPIYIRPVFDLIGEIQGRSVVHSQFEPAALLPQRHVSWMQLDQDWPTPVVDRRLSSYRCLRF